MNPKLLICGGVSIVVIILIIIILATSFSKVAVNEYALAYSSWSKSVSKNIYPPGIHFIGPFQSFITYPSTFETFEFSKLNGADRGPLRSRTKDGLEVEIEISFQYTLEGKQIRELYFEYTDQQFQPFMNAAVDILTDTATYFQASQFFANRSLIQEKMYDNLNSTFYKNCYSSIDYFQLRSVDLPNPYEAAIEQTEVKRQDIMKAQAERDKTSVELETRIKQALVAQNITLNNAQADASVTLQRNGANVESFRVNQWAQLQAYTSLKSQLNLNDTDFIQFLNNKLITGYDGGSVLIALK